MESFTFANSKLFHETLLTSAGGSKALQCDQQQNTDKVKLGLKRVFSLEVSTNSQQCRPTIHF